MKLNNFEFDSFINNKDPRNTDFHNYTPIIGGGGGGGGGGGCLGVFCFGVYCLGVFCLGGGGVFVHLYRHTFK